MNFKTNFLTNECPSAIGTVRCTTCGGLISGELQYTGDNYCKGHDPEFQYEELDFPVRIKPNESFKIRVKIKRINSNSLYL